MQDGPAGYLIYYTTERRALPDSARYSRSFAVTDQDPAQWLTNEIIYRRRQDRADIYLDSVLPLNKEQFDRLVEASI